MKDKSYSARAIDNVIKMRKKYIGNITNDDFNLDKMDDMDLKAKRN